MLRAWSHKTKRDSRPGRAGCGLQSSREDADRTGACRLYVGFVIPMGERLNIRNKVVATFDGRQIRRINTIGQLVLSITGRPFPTTS